jgi:hypothetical protein
LETAKRIKGVIENEIKFGGAGETDFEDRRRLPKRTNKIW